MNLGRRLWLQLKINSTDVNVDIPYALAPLEERVSNHFRIVE
ncbi:MAG: hypothetical protein WD737_11740 [Gemmatimonadota bacterium]